MLIVSTPHRASDICFWNSEHASTAKLKGVLELGRVGFRAGNNHVASPQKPDWRNRPPSPAHQRKTGIYNTLATAGQTYSWRLRTVPTLSSERIDFLAPELPAEALRYRSQISLQRFPIVRPPSRRQVRGRPIWKANMIEYQPGFRSLLLELESCDRVKTRRPIFFPPGLNNSFMGSKFNMAANDYAAKNRERAADLAANLRRGASHNEVRDLAKLLFIGQRFVDALWRRLEHNFLMNALASMRDSISIRLRAHQPERSTRNSQQRRGCQAERKVSSGMSSKGHAIALDLFRPAYFAPPNDAAYIASSRSCEWPS